MELTKSRINIRFLMVGLTIIFVAGCGDPVEKVRQGESCQDCILTGADLPGISLEGLDLSGSDLTGANLSSVVVNSETSLKGANLSNVDLSGSTLSGGDFSEVNLSGANLSNVVIDAETSLKGANLSNVDLSGATLSGVDFSGINLNGSNLSDIKIETGTKFKNSDLSGASFENAQIRGEDPTFSAEHIFDTTNLTNTNFSNANIRTVSFDDSNLSGANLFSIDASEVQLRDANLTNVNFENAKILEGDIRASDLSGANLSNFDGSGVGFWDVNFTGATLSNFKVGTVHDPIFPSLDNAPKLLAETKSALRKIVKTNRAEDMLFDVGLGLTYELSGKGDVKDIYGGFRSRGVIEVTNFIGALQFDLPERLQQQIDQAFSAEKSFRPTNLVKRLCGMPKDLALSNFSEFIDDEETKELLLHIVDHLEKGKDGGCRDSSDFDQRVSSSLQDYIYDYYNGLIEISGINECKQTIDNPEKAFNRLKTRDLNSPKTSLGLTILSQTIPRYQKEVDDYNTCVNSAYEKFNVGVNSLYDSMIRVYIAVNQGPFLAKVERSADGRKRSAATKRYTDELSALAGQLYDEKDLIPEMISVQAMVALQGRATEIAYTGGDGVEWIESQMKKKVLSFRRSMTQCLTNDVYWEQDDKKRSSIIAKFKSAATEKYSDDDLNAKMKSCQYNANVAYLNR